MFTKYQFFENFEEKSAHILVGLSETSAVFKRRLYILWIETVLKEQIVIRLVSICIGHLLIVGLPTFTLIFIVRNKDFFLFLKLRKTTVVMLCKHEVVCDWLKISLRKYDSVNSGINNDFFMRIRDEKMWVSDGETVYKVYLTSYSII